MKNIINNAHEITNCLARIEVIEDQTAALTKEVCRLYTNYTHLTANLSGKSLEENSNDPEIVALRNKAEYLSKIMEELRAKTSAEIEYLDSLTK